MTTYAVTRDLTGIDMEGLAAAQQEAIAASEDFSQTGTPVSYLRSIYQPDAQACTCLFEATEVGVVADVQARAGLPFDSISEVLDLTP